MRASAGGLQGAAATGAALEVAPHAATGQLHLRDPLHPTTWARTRTQAGMGELRVNGGMDEL